MVSKYVLILRISEYIVPKGRISPVQIFYICFANFPKANQHIRRIMSDNPKDILYSVQIGLHANIYQLIFRIIQLIYGFLRNIHLLGYVVHTNRTHAILPQRLRCKRNNPFFYIFIHEFHIAKTGSNNRSFSINNNQYTLYRKNDILTEILHRNKLNKRNTKIYLSN